MKTIIQKIAAIFMALTVMISTMSFTLSKHYCGGEMVAWSVLSDVADCGMEVNSPIQGEDCEVLKPNCCLNLNTQIEGQVDLKTTVVDKTAHPEFAASSFLQTEELSIVALKRFFVPFDGYPPPLIVQDFQVLYEVFII